MQADAHEAGEDLRGFAPCRGVGADLPDDELRAEREDIALHALVFALGVFAVDAAIDDADFGTGERGGEIILQFGGVGIGGVARHRAGGGGGAEGGDDDRAVCGEGGFERGQMQGLARGWRAGWRGGGAEARGQEWREQSGEERGAQAAVAGRVKRQHGGADPWVCCL